MATFISCAVCNWASVSTCARGGKANSVPTVLRPPSQYRWEASSTSVQLLPAIAICRVHPFICTFLFPSLFSTENLETKNRGEKKKQQEKVNQSFRVFRSVAGRYPSLFSGNSLAHLGKDVRRPPASSLSSSTRLLHAACVPVDGVCVARSSCCPSSSIKIHNQTHALMAADRFCCRRDSC